MKSLYVIGATLLSSLSFYSQACSYDGQFNNPFAESYPGSIDVAIATYDALDSQRFSAVSPLTGTPGLQRASWWLKLMADRHSAQLESVSYIYLVDSHLWSKLETDQSIKVHLAPSDAKPTSVLLLSEAALNALIQKQMDFAQALELGVIRFSS